MPQAEGAGRAEALRWGQSLAYLRTRGEASVPGAEGNKVSEVMGSLASVRC